MALYELNNFIAAIESWGLTDVMLPFLLIFTLVFAVLQKTEILGKDKKNFNVVISLVVALTVIIPHVTGRYPMSYDPINIINSFLPAVSLVLIGVLMLFVLLGILGNDAEWFGKSASGMMAFLAIIVILWIFGASAGWWQGWNWFTSFFGEDAISLIIIILVFGIIIWFITKSDTQTAGDSVLKNLKDLFKIKK